MSEYAEIKEGSGDDEIEGVLVRYSDATMLTNWAKDVSWMKFFSWLTPLQNMR